eukprot:TRINITY_DN9194_c0_g1_i1.p1 TRINITY_DN9194_c0_g1~~TRINITY_DN9194_c0_g1_i1.p1  ORF type:complete len:489 (-),score=109.10 TRINITY_DN9194_c0_g1_i1:122-1588(-)
MEYDAKLEERKQSFKKVKTDIVRKVEGYAQLLRKNFRESAISRHRIKAITLTTSRPAILNSADSCLSKICAAETESQVHSALGDLKVIVAHGDTSFRDHVAVQVLPSLVSLLGKGSARVQSEAACIFCLLTASESETVFAPLMDPENVRLFVALVNTSSFQVPLMHSLANVTASSTKYRDMLIEEGIVDKLISLFSKKHLEAEVHDAGIFLICNMFAVGPITSTSKVKGLIPYAIEALWVTREVALADALWMLKYITESDALANNLETVNADTVIRILIHAQNKNPLIANPAIEVLGNLSAGADYNGELLTTCGAIDVVKEIMEESEEPLKKREAAWILSNLVACGPLVISEFLAVKVHLTILKYLNEESMVVVKEMAWVVCNCLVKGSDTQVQTLLDDGVVLSYLRLLYLNDFNMKFLILDTLSKLLSNLKESTIKSSLLRQMNETKLPDKLEEIMNESNETNSELAKSILKELANWCCADYEMGEF